MARRGYVKPKKVLARLNRRIAQFERLTNNKGYTKPGSQQGGNGRTVARKEEAASKSV